MRAACRVSDLPEVAVGGLGTRPAQPRGLQRLPVGGRGGLRLAEGLEQLAQLPEQVRGGTSGGQPLQLARGGAQDEAEARYATLSDREREVFRLTALGYAPARIGEQLLISGKTVDTYRRRIADKLDMTDRAEWVRLALRLGILVEEGE